MSRKLKLATLVIASAAGVASAGTVTLTPQIGQPQVSSAQPVYSQPMNRLIDTAQHLRQAIREMAQRPAGPERNVAIAKAREALRQTQQAMLDLPPEYRSYGATSGAAGYDDSVKSLMAASDTLRDAIHAMAREPAGRARNQAIRDANRALMQTQVAMANAYDVTAFGQPGTTTMGAGPGSHCAWLGTMYGCPAH